MRSVTAEKSALTRSSASSDNDFTSLATPIFEIIMQIKAGLITPSNDLRREIDELLKQVEQRGEEIGYKARSVEDVKFALTALIDETVLTADFALRDDWVKYPLQLEYYGHQTAGIKFFDRLKEMLKNPDADVSVIETYYLCLLLGYEGKHKKYYLQELKTLIENVADYLRRENRLRAVALSPHWKVTDQPLLANENWLPTWVKITSGVALAALILIYSILKLFLGSELKEAVDKLLR
jgi:type VI secretion system protein ImpK